MLSRSLAFATIAAVTAFFQLTLVGYGSQIPVVGDRRILEVLVDAQATNLASLEFGRLEATVTNDLTNQSCDVTIIWDGPLTYRSYEEVRNLPGKEAMKSVIREVRVESPNEIWAYNPKGRIAFHQFSKLQRHAAMLWQVRPDEFWFRMFNGSHDWKVYFDPDHKEWDRGVVRRWKILEEENGEIPIQLEVGAGATVEIVASLAHGGNVISYRTIVPVDFQGSGLLRFGTYKWAQDGEERWYLHEAHLGQQSLKPGVKPADPPVPFIHFLTRSFEAGKRPPSEQLAEEALQILPGTPVRTKHADGRETMTGYRSKDSEAPVRTPADVVLERQIDILRQSGFIKRTAR